MSSDGPTEGIFVYIFRGTFYFCRVFDADKSDKTDKSAAV